jgi:hypothetical protein
MPAKKYFAAATLLTLAVAAGAAEETMTSEKPYNQGSYQGTPWVSGGVGIEERNRMLETLADDYNLKLEFAVAQGNYLGDVSVRITNADGAVVMDAKSSGPWFLTKLPPGTYGVQASGFGETFEQTVQLPATGLHTLVFNQWTKAGVAQETPGPTY